MIGRLERCCACDDPTDKAGSGEDSLFLENGDGPFCEDCWEDIPVTLKGHSIDNTRTN